MQADYLLVYFRRHLYTPEPIVMTPAMAPRVLRPILILSDVLSSDRLFSTWETVINVPEEANKAVIVVNHLEAVSSARGEWVISLLSLLRKNPSLLLRHVVFPLLQHQVLLR